VCISVSLSGCLTLGTLEIEVIKPSKITLPSTINSVLIINNCLLNHPDSFINEVQKGLYNLDTTTTQILVQQVNGLLNESPRFDTSILINKIFFRKQQDIMQPIQWNAIQQLGAKYNVDAILSLEAFGIIDSIIGYSVYDGFGYSTYRNLALFANSMWRIYLVNEEKILERNIQRDTLVLWEIASKNDYLKALSEPAMINYLAENLSATMSLKIADRIAPYWQPVQRDFFIYGNSEMQIATQYAYKDNWRAAALIWKSFTDHENKRLSGAACHNMALVCEVEGKLDIAEKWLIQALKKYNNNISHEYLKQIRIRIKESKQLDSQFGIE
jgi:hypothetical protein